GEPAGPPLLPAPEADVLPPDTATLPVETPDAPGLLPAGMPAKLAADRTMVMNLMAAAIRAKRGATSTLTGITPQLVAKMSKDLLVELNAAQLAALLSVLEELAVDQVSAVKWTVAPHRAVQAACAPVNKAVSSVVLLELLNTGVDYSDKLALAGEIRAGWLRV